MKQVTRCPECDEPEFMCECAKNFRGEVIREVYHRGSFVGDRQERSACFYLSLRPTIIVNQTAKMLVSPKRHDQVVQHLLGV